MDEFVRACNNSPNAINIIGKRALTDLTRQVQGKAKENTPKAFGKLQGSIGKSVRGLTGEVFVGENYGIYVEKGTRPHFPPVEALRAWCALKLGDGALAYAVAKKIGEKGTKSQPFLEPAVDSSIGDIDRIFGNALDGFLKTFI